MFSGSLTAAEVVVWRMIFVQMIPRVGLPTTEVRVVVANPFYERA